MYIINVLEILLLEQLKIAKIEIILKKCQIDVTIPYIQIAPAEGYNSETARLNMYMSKLQTSQIILIHYSLSITFGFQKFLLRFRVIPNTARVRESEPSYKLNILKTKTSGNQATGRCMHFQIHTRQPSRQLPGRTSSDILITNQ